MRSNLAHLAILAALASSCASSHSADLFCDTSADCPGEAPQCGGREATCAAVCQAEVTCSAASPVMVCGCDGVVRSAAAGCPGPHERVLAHAEIDLAGVRCDEPASYVIRLAADDVPTPAVRIDVEPRDGAAMAPAVRGLAPELAGGTLELAVGPVVDPSFAGYTVRWLLDADADGECDAGAERGGVEVVAVDRALVETHGADVVLPIARAIDCDGLFE